MDSDGDVAQQVEDFLRDNPVDENASMLLRTAGAEAQQAVLARGNLTTGLRNPSAA